MMRVGAFVTWDGRDRSASATAAQKKSGKAHPWPRATEAARVREGGNLPTLSFRRAALFVLLAHGPSRWADDKPNAEAAPGGARRRINRVRRAKFWQSLSQQAHKAL